MPNKQQTIKPVIDTFNFVYYSFVHSMRPHVTSVADFKLNYILTLLTYPWYTKQTREHKAWHFSIFITSAYSIKWKISPASCRALTSCWNLLHQTNGLYYTRGRFISANLLGWQIPTEFSTFHQSCQQFPGFGRITNKILLVKAEIPSQVQLLPVCHTPKTDLNFPHLIIVWRDI